MRDALPTTIAHRVTTLPTVQLYTVAQLHIDSDTTVHQLLHLIQNDARLFSCVEGVQSGEYDTR